MKNRPVTRYHPVLVTLHWLLAILIIAALAIGAFWLAPTPNADPRKVDILRLHMSAGMLIFCLMAIRFVVRMLTSRPAVATTGHAGLDRVATLTHYGFYVLVLLMVGTGYATGILAGLPAIVFGGSGDPLPPSFATYPTFTAHRILAVALAAFIALHALAALWHHVGRRDGLLRRIWFGRRRTPAPAE
jgi:cytochrome b561